MANIVEWLQTMMLSYELWWGLAIAASLVCWTYLVVAARAIRRTSLKSVKRSNDPAIADLLNYAGLIEDGVVINKNGSLTAAWLYKGKDLASAVDSEKDSVALIARKAVARFGNGWMLHVDAARVCVPSYPDESASNFGDALTKEIDDERRRQFTGAKAKKLYENTFVISLTYLPPILIKQKINEMLYETDSNKEEKGSAKRTKALLMEFQKAADEFANMMSTKFSLIRLKGHKFEEDDGSSYVLDDLLRWIEYCVTGIRRPVRLPKNPMYLDLLIGGQEVWSGTVPKIGRKYVMVVAIDGFPSESSPSMLSWLSELDLEYRWSTRFICIDDNEAVKQIEKFQKFWRQKVRGFWSVLMNTPSPNYDMDAMGIAEEGNLAIKEIKSGATGDGYYTSVVVLMGEDKESLELAAEHVKSQIAQRGFGARIETINAMEAWLGSLPGHGYENVRRPALGKVDFANLIPSSSVWTGREYAPCKWYPRNSPALLQGLTDGSTAFRLNLHVTDVGHTLIAGATGAGKSTLLGMIAAQARRYQGMQIFTFDKDFSMYPLTAGIRAATEGRTGIHYDIGGDQSTLQFAPLHEIDTDSERSWAAQWVCRLCELNGLNLTPETRSEIQNSIKSLATLKQRSLSALSQQVQDPSVRAVLEEYTNDGSLSRLLDAETDSLKLADFCTFEMGQVLKMPDRAAIPIMDYMFHRIEKRLKEALPTIIIVDELLAMLGSSVMEERLIDFLTTARKKNGAVVFATTNLPVVAQLKVFNVINESTATKIFLPDPAATSPESAAIYKRLGLNDRELNILSHATPKHEYYYLSRDGGRKFRLGLGPVAHAFAATTDAGSVNQIKSLEDMYGHDWVEHWKQMQIPGYTRNVKEKAA